MGCCVCVFFFWVKCGLLYCFKAGIYIAFHSIYLGNIILKNVCIYHPISYSLDMKILSQVKR